MVPTPPVDVAGPAEEPQPARCAPGESGEECYERASALIKAHGTSSATKTAFELFQSGCSLGSSLACNGAAWGFIHGDGGVKDPAAAGDFLARGCPTGNEHPATCDSRGFALLTGFAATRRDPDLATRLFVNACRGGERYSCATLNLYGPLGLPEAQEISRPDLVCHFDLQDLEDACFQRSGPQECWLGSLMAATGTCMAADEDKSQELHRAAVTLGVPWPALP